MSETSQRGFAPVILLFLVALIAVGAGAYLYGKGGLKPPTKQPASSGAQVSTTPTPLPLVFQKTDTSGWKVYENTAVGFSLKYPSFLDKPKLPSGAGDSPVLYATGKEKENSIIFASSQRKYPGFELAVFPFAGKLEKLIDLEKTMPYDKTFIYYDGDSFLSKVEDIKVSEQEGVWYKTANDPSTTKQANGQEVWWVGKGYAFILDTQRGTLSDEAMDLDTVNAIISTFKFTQ